MQSCLGIYIQKNLIKYAKISKEHTSFKIEAYGIKFYDSNVEETIEQIVKETFSYHIPISVNIDKEKYTYSDIFNLLKPQDRNKAINTEFEFFCNNNNKNKNSLEVRTIKAPNLEDRDKIRVIYTYIEKANIVERMQMVDNYKICSVSPIAPIIPEVNKIIMQENCIVVNLEKNTEITTIQNGAIYRVDTIEKGMGDILDSIAERENSISKAYEVCKNTTVYTKSGQNLKLDGNEYLEEIITVLFEIIENVKETIIQNGVEVNSIYLSGMGLVINNIDLLFQESFINKKCEILVPYFIEKTNVKINIKDYIEVNSAIALAIQGIDTKKQEVNFSPKANRTENLMNILTRDVGKKSPARVKKEKPKVSFKQSMKAELDIIEKMMLRGITGLILLIMLYIPVTDIIVKQTNEKIEKTDEVITGTTAEIENVKMYNNMVNEKTGKYQEAIASIEASNSKISESYSSKNAIPNLLTNIMSIIPSGVQILLIKNPTAREITIVAQAEKYDQLGYFKAVLEEEGILTNIITSNATKKANLISVTINGELNY